MAELTDKQKTFCEEYIKDMNASEAYIRAGYKIKDSNVAKAAASRMLANVNVKTYIAELRGEVKSKNIADAKEIREFLTNVLRGEESEENAMAIRASGHT